MTWELKRIIKARLPFLVPPLRRFKTFASTRKPPRRLFTEIFNRNRWGDIDSRSGPGSNLAQTEAVRRVLPDLLKELSCKRFLDVPCGDFFWMRTVKIEVEYIGADIVGEIVAQNQEKYGSEDRRFIDLDLLNDIPPRVDVVLCRDCLVHFSTRHIRRAIKSIKDSGSTYLLTTTFIGRRSNEDIPTGSWRAINLELPPFNFPPPERLVNEECPVDHQGDKHLGLWRIDDIPEF